MLIFLLLLVFATDYARSEDCNLISKEGHGNLQVHGHGLHRQIELTTFIQAKSRVSQCRLMYSISIPDEAYVDERELVVSLLFIAGFVIFRLTSALPGYEIVFGDSKKKDNRLIYIVRQKLFLSTFEMKEKLKFPVHLLPPSKQRLPEVKFFQPIIAVDCKGNFTGCPTTGIQSKDARVKPTSGKWLQVKPWEKIRTFVDIFRGEPLFPELPLQSLFILAASLSFSMFYLMN
ncbi:hypothetical protein CRE_17188 [Caenorhabditis remanei]|uniref:Uncharacterized protein n=1 Tax=Caenorhabditis remanei TaxID=31234 RepID=E3M9Y6_CAERE|nr:hypothetical protein CRE_17188 [Caenorhabditis remanei]